MWYELHVHRLVLDLPVEQHLVEHLIRDVVGVNTEHTHTQAYAGLCRTV